MIDLYTANTFTGQRVSIMLEETGLPYTAHGIDLTKGEQYLANFLRLNPSHRIPVLVDYDHEYSDPLVVTQSVAILQYLAEKTQLLLPELLSERAKVYEWMHFHAVDIGSTLFNAFYLQHRSNPKQVEAADQLRQRIHGLYKFFDQQLASNEFMASASFSIADITAFPAVITQEYILSEYPNLTRWALQIKQRPAVQRGMAIPKLEINHAH